MLEEVARGLLVGCKEGYELAGFNVIIKCMK